MNDLHASRHSVQCIYWVAINEQWKVSRTCVHMMRGSHTSYVRLCNGKNIYPRCAAVFHTFSKSVVNLISALEACVPIEQQKKNKHARMYPGTLQHTNLSIDFVSLLSMCVLFTFLFANTLFLCFRSFSCAAFCIYRKHRWTAVRISFCAEQAQRVESYHQILLSHPNVCCYHFINIYQQSWYQQSKKESNKTVPRYTHTNWIDVFKSRLNWFENVACTQCCMMKSMLALRNFNRVQTANPFDRAWMNGIAASSTIAITIVINIDPHSIVNSLETNKKKPVVIETIRRFETRIWLSWANSDVMQRSDKL